MEKTLLITKKDLDKDNYYIGKDDVENYAGHIKISGGLGRVKFKGALCASLSILAEAGSGIEAG